MPSSQIHIIPEGKKEEKKKKKTITYAKEKYEDILGESFHTQNFYYCTSFPAAFYRIVVVH